MTDPLDVAHDQLRYGTRPIVEIADDLGCSVQALNDRLRRRFGTTARALRTGEAPSRGRPATDRESWQVRLSADEREIVDAAVAREREAGAPTDGAALVAALQRGGRRSSRAR